MQNLSAFDIYQNIDKFVDSLLNVTPVTIDLEVQSLYSTMPARMLIKSNDVVLFDDIVAELVQLQFHHTMSARHNTITFAMRDKSAGDTRVANGKIIEDKALIIKKLHINQFDVIGDHDFFTRHFQYYNRDEEKFERVKSGFWHNSDLVLKYTGSWNNYYNTNSDKNCTLSPELALRDLENKQSVMAQVLSSINKLSL